MKTIIDFFEESVEKFGNNIYMWEKRDGKYEGTTYSKIREAAHQVGAGLLRLGLKKGDRVALLSEGRNDWIICELGILYAGGVNVPLSVKLSDPLEVKFRLEHSGSRIVIVSKNQVLKIKEIKYEITGLEKIILLDTEEEYDKDEIFMDEVRKKGTEMLQANREEFDKTWRSIQENDYANICYTSGTTADPKGIILTHLNYVTNVEQGYSLIHIPQNYKTLLILPWDHSFAHTAGLYGFMGKGASIASIQTGKTPMETLKNIPQNIKEIKPNLLLSVPALAKNFRKNIERGIREKGPMVEKLFNIAMKMAYNYNKEGYNKAKGLQILKKPIYGLFDKILFKKIREGFGGELDFFIGGGALLDIELQRFFYAIGIPMFQGYGLTEAAPIISANSIKKHKLGSSGFLVKNLELKICDDDGNKLSTGEKGEIVVKGDNVMTGYWKNKEATDNTLKDGWLYTGDMGYMDNDGFLYVLGRYKSLLISDDGEKYSPEGIEEAITEKSLFIDQCMLYNNQKPFTIALIVPNVESLNRFLKENNLSGSTKEGQVVALHKLESEINEYKTGGKYENMFPQRWLPPAVGVLDETFTEENQLLNSTLKMVRGKIVEKYKELLNFLYTPEAKEITNERNIHAVSKLK
jgi:long-chain acyl-CoA synthetase